MNWLLFPLFALAQASCYDYEYYDPDTGKSIPGNACAGQAAAAAGASVGQPQTLQATTTFGSAPQFGAPVAQFASAPVASAQFASAPQFAAPQFATPQFASAPQFGAVASVGTPIYGSGTPVYGATPIVGAAVGTPVYGAAVGTPVYGAAVGTPVYGAAVGTPVYGAGTPVYGAPAAVAVSSQVSFAAPRAAATVAVAAPRAAAPAQNSNQLSPELEYYRRLGIQQARQHKQNKKIVDQATRDLQRSSLVNTITKGTGADTWYPLVRLDAQKDAAGAYKSEARIANKNADDAYKRYQKDPSRINLLVSKYQDLNADLRDAAYHYNVINSGTFGQQVVQTSLFGLPTSSSGLFNTLTQIITQKQQTQDLQDIQRQMQRVALQIQNEAKAAQAAKSAPTAQTTVQQRLMATSVYGPPRGR